MVVVRNNAQGDHEKGGHVGYQENGGICGGFGLLQLSKDETRRVVSRQVFIKQKRETPRGRAKTI